jgi:4-hydroxybenzoate polyprenyltransferase
MPLVKVIAGFFRLIRLPNLIFIALTQLLLQYCIYEPLYRPFLTFDDTRQFVFLVFASIFIAAAGYIINDYFDVDIDQINKPSRLVIGKLISKRGSIFLHFIFNAAGLVFTFLATRSIQQSYLVFLNLGVIFLLWFYSVRFKKTLLIGNIIISFLVAWVIVIFFLSKMDPMQLIRGADKSQSIFYQLTILYAGFAFLSTFIRELIKDVEDQDGDRRHGCKTLPIMWGIVLTRTFIASWVVILALLVIFVMVYLLQLKMRIAFLYSFGFVLVPIFFLFKKLTKSITSKDFGKLSARMKWLLLAGIISMIFFYSR